MEKLYAAARAGKPAKLFAVLNARFHEQEAYIVAEAGVPGAITIATNMAGRGTDIKLGGSLEMRIQQETADITDEAEKAAKIEQIKADIERFREIVLKAEDVVEVEPAKGSKPAKTITKPGGLYIMGSERHESRRIDNQLRGRSGRQGDPGRSKFFLSLEDDLMRIFGSDRLDSMLQRLGLKEGEAIIHPWINKALEKAQQKVEARNFDIRKNLLKFDNVQNDQRKVIFDQRVELMKSDSVAEMVADMRHDFIDDIVAKHVPEHAYAEQWDVAGLKEELKRVLDVDLPVDEWAKEEGIADEELLTRIEQRVDEHMAAKVAQWGPDVMRYVEKTILLQTLDHLWREHLIMLDHLRQVIGLRGYGQRDPLQEYKSEAFGLYRGDDRASARGGDGAIDARRDRAAGRAAAGAAADGSAQVRSQYRRRRDGVRQRLAGAGGRRRRSRSQKSRKLGQGRPQRGLPLRLRQEVQALPRQVRLGANSISLVAFPATTLVAGHRPPPMFREHVRRLSAPLPEPSPII